MTETTVFDVIEKGSPQGLALLLKDDSGLASVRNDVGVSSVLYSCYMRKPEMTECLLEHGNLTLDVFDASALGDLDRLIELALEDPDCVHKQARDGFFPLHLACFFANTETASFLIAQGVDTNALSGAPMNLRPLHSAVAVSNFETARLLLQHGANPNEAQRAGWTPLHSAATHGDLELARLLLEHGANPASVAEAGKTPADLARDGGNAELAKLLSGAS